VNPGRILGLDYGTRRIGVALSDALQLTAQPLAVLDADPVSFVEELRRLVTEHNVEMIVVGLPVNLQGEETESAREARKLAELAESATGLPVRMADERFTTRTAEQVLVAANVRRSRRRGVVDKVAAAVMLQAYLDGR